MGYFGRDIFENDRASDWLSGLTTRNAGTRIRKALNDFRRFNPKDVKEFDETQIEDMVAKLIAYYRHSPPATWAQDTLTMEEQLHRVEAETRDHFTSKRYLDEEYGPAEEGLAAATIVAMWADPSLHLTHDGVATEIAARLRAKAIPADLVGVAGDTVDKILHNLRYARMRKHYLEAFPLVSGGNDSMDEVKTLARALRALATS